MKGVFFISGRDSQTIASFAGHVLMVDEGVGIRLDFISIRYRKEGSDPDRLGQPPRASNRLRGDLNYERKN
ncbi:MAG: hypothetical protein JRI26_05390 [Deltaproteobacteria bacterium]|nr:hypothetical protein [Deltaproteobacteria bacterium]